MATVLEGAERGSDEDLSQTVELASREQCRGLVVDSYTTDEGYFSKASAAGLVVTAIDDMAAFPFPCDLVVSGGIQADALAYVSSTGKTRFLLGPEYALLREEFWNVEPRRTKGRVERVLVTMGGADGRNLTPVVVKLLDTFEEEFEVTVTVGPFFKNYPEVQDAARGCRRAVRLVHAPESVHDLMIGADFAVSAGGQTLSELAAAGTPVAAVQAADNQAGNVHYFADQEAVTPVTEQQPEKLTKSLADAIRSLLASADLRAEMSQAGQRLIDGRGSMRVATVLAEIVERATQNARV